MPVHWTYTDVEEREDLTQGDIVLPTEELVSVLKEVHGYFDNPRYIGFLVLTQGCDLVTRKATGCKARYVTLAAIRELDQVLPRILREISGHNETSPLITERRVEAEQFVARLIDQNEQSRGLFYLHADGDAGIATASIAFLRVSFSLRRQHYPVIQRARKGRLDPQFSSKLGWLSGNLFSRVATPDWDEKEGAGSGKSFAKKLLKESANESLWIPESWIRNALKAGVNISALSDLELPTALGKYAPPNPIDEVKDEVIAAARDVLFAGIADEFQQQLESDEELWAAAIGCVESQLSEIIDEDRKNIFMKALSERTGLKSLIAKDFVSMLRKAAKAKGDTPFLDSIESRRPGGSCYRPVVTELNLIWNTVNAEDVPSNAPFAQEGFYSNAVFDVVEKLIRDIEDRTPFSEMGKLAGRIENSSKIKAMLKPRR